MKLGLMGAKGGDWMSKLKTSIQAKVQTQADKEKAENYFKECDGTSYSLTVH